MSVRTMSKHTTKDHFHAAVQEDVKTLDSETGETTINDKDISEMYIRRLMDGICVKDKEELHLLCDDSRSLMQVLFNQQLVILRAFKCPV